MKKTTTLWMLLLVGSALYAQQITYQMNFSTNDVEISEIDGYDHIALVNQDQLQGEENAGEPQLPVKYFNLLLPQGATASSVNISVGQETQIVGNFDLYPVQLPAYPNFEEPPPFVGQDPTIYGSNTPYPQNNLLYYSNSVYRDFNFVSIAFIPFKYLPLDQKLYLQTQLTVNVTYTINPTVAPHKLRPYNGEDLMAYNNIGKSVANPNQTAAFYPEVVSKLNIYNGLSPIPGTPFETTPLPALEGSEVKYVIITNVNLAAHFQPFADWKTQNGTPAKIVTVETISTNYPGMDVPEKIRNFIKAAHELWGTEYVLLGGDSDIVPIRMVIHSMEMATDLYYSAIVPYNDNWNANGNNIFGEPGECDFTADIAVGRAPVDTPAEVANFLKKNFIYGRSEAFAPPNSIPSGAWLGKTLMGYGAAFDYPWASSCALRIGYEIIQEHHANTDIYSMMEYKIDRNIPDINNPESWCRAYYSLYSGCTENQIPIIDGKLYHDDFINKINEGFGFINVLDHGGPFNLGIGTITQNPHFSVQDIQNLNDTGKYGILLGSGCHTVPLERDFYFGEQWLNNAGGGVAYFGASADVFVSDGYDFSETFFDALFDSNVFKLGKIHGFAASNVPGENGYASKIYQVLGDPDLSIYNKEPSNMAVTHATTITNGNQDFDITVSGFPAGEEVLVSLYKEGEVLAYKTTNSFPHTFNITPDTVGELNITATCHNREPYEASIPVTQFSSTHLYKSDFTLMDDNANGILEPGENVAISFDLSNTGATGATGISAVLVAEGTNVTITQPTSSYPNIASGQTGSSNADYTFSINTAAATGSGIEFKLLIESDQDDFIEPFLLNIEGPVLDMGNRSARVNDVETSVFNVNDAVDLFVDLHNLGAIMASDVEAELSTSLPPSIVSIIDGTYLYGDINSYSQATNTDAFNIAIGSAYNGEPLIFDLTLTDAFGKTDIFTLNLTDTPPGNINGFDYTSTDDEISIFWNHLPNIKGYNVYRANTETGMYAKMNDFLIIGTARYDDFEVQPYTEYWYKISIVKLSGDERDIELIDAHTAHTKIKRHPGFPVQAYPMAASSGISSPIVYDIDGDANKEIFLNYRNQANGVTLDGRIMGFKSTGQELFDIDNNPSQVWGFAATDLELWSNPAVGDIDNDGNAEVFAVGRKHEDNLGKLYGFHTIDSNNDGKPDVWESNLIPSPGPGPINIGKRAMMNPVLSDLNNDGYLEIIVLDEHQRISVYNHEKEKLGERSPFATGYSGGELAVADVDGDGYNEIVLSCEKNNNINNNGAIYIWDHNGIFSGGLTDDLNLLKQFNSGERADSGPILADIDNDGKYEVLTITRKEITEYQAEGRVYAINIENGTAVSSNWNGSTIISLPTGDYKGTVMPRIAVGDLNNDGNLEIVFGSKDKLYVLDNNGSSLTGFPITITTTEASSPILADVDEDDAIEIIINQMLFDGHGKQIKGTIHAYNYDGSSCLGWELLSTTAPFVNSPYIGDIDDDGYNEMVISSTDYTTYVWDTTGAADKVEWGSYRENAQNTAVYKEKCNFSNAASIQINSGSIQTWNSDRHIQGNLVIKPNANLTITGSKITFARNSKLIIEPGGKLTLNGATLTNECGSFWKGIRVQGNYNLAQTPTNQGTLVLINGAKIENAEIGVYVGTDPSLTTLNNGAGGLIEVDDAEFINNLVGIDLPSYPNNTSSYIKNSLFENSDYLTNRGTLPTANIRVWKVKPIIVENNIFRNLQEIDPYTNTHDLPIQGNGIVGTDAKLDILNNQFENLNSAIKLQATGSAFAITYINIGENTFENNWNAVSLNSIDGVEITSNAIDVFDTFLDGQGVDGSSGIYIVNSNGFHIENNNIYSSTAQGFSTGIFIRDCQAVNEIYRNQFTDLDTGVFAMGQNIKASSGLPDLSQGLQLICNEFNDNATDIYTAPLTRIANYQGTATLSAGNTFSPECSGGTNEFNNQGYQVNYRGEIGGIYLPSCNYNVNVFSNSGHNGCESTLGRPYGATDITDSDMEIDQNRIQYYAYTDGGDTEALNGSIEETENNEALELRNELLEVSPFLSDTIIVKTTAIEDILPAIMVKDILMANPKAAKSDKIQLALDNRQEQLPTYMRAEIDLGKTIFSQKEVLEENLSQSFHKKEDILNRIMLSLKRDSLVSSIDSLETMLVSEAPINLNRNYQLVDYYLSKEETQSAQTIYNDIPQNFQLNSKEQEEYDQLGDLLDIQLTIIDEDKSLFEMSNEQLTTLTALALDSTAVAGMKSRAILSLVNGTDYGLPIPAKVEGYNREATPTESEEGTLKVFPAVADKYFIVEYSLASDETIENTKIKIVDNENKEIKLTGITSRENQILMECEKWQEGVYWAVKTVSGKIIDSQSILIDRGHLPTNIERKNPMDQEDLFGVFPNPAQDYFFVITNYDNESNLQATNSLGQVVGNYSITEKEFKISTSSWSKGVYYLTLTRENFSRTIKIIIK